MVRVTPRGLSVERGRVQHLVGSRWAGLGTAAKADPSGMPLCVPMQSPGCPCQVIVRSGLSWPPWLGNEASSHGALGSTKNHFFPGRLARTLHLVEKRREACLAGEQVERQTTGSKMKDDGVLASLQGA